MPILFSQLREQLENLSNVLKQINADQYRHACRFLGDSSIGGHTRHIIELLQCALKGYETGEVDYFNRSRNLGLEMDKDLALQAVDQLRQMEDLKDRPVQVFAGEGSMIQSTFYRELLYNIEHAIHHLALIKVSLVELDMLPTDPNFGMAYSTIQYRKESEKAN